MDLKKRLYGLRNEKGYSVATLSKKSGVSASHIQRIESGESGPTVDTMTKICKSLDAKGIPTPSKYKKLQGSNFVSFKCPSGAEYWNKSTVKRILTNETYDGILIQNETETISHNIKKRRKVPKNEQTITACSHEKIVDSRISKIVRGKFSSRTKPTQSGEGHIFSQKVYCECCEKIFQKNSCKSGAKKIAYLSCKTKLKAGVKGCENTSAIRIDFLEEAILKEINRQIDKYYNKTEFEKSYYKNKVNSN